MPFAARTIEPVYLGQRPLREEEKKKEVVQLAITQNAVLGALVQLASLVRHADDLFCDLADECQQVFDHTERIIHRVKRIKERVGRLDSKKVPIPVGDLKQFTTVQDHHESKHGHDCSFFTPDSRPHCIRGRYSLCEVTPVGSLRGADMYRKDGMRSSNLFKLWPVVLREHHVKTPDLNLPRKQGKAMTFDKKYKRLTPRPKTVHGTENLDFAQLTGTNETTSLGSTVSDNLSKSQPSIMVAVDTSGTGFYRMSSFRQSLKSTTTTTTLERKKRRRTVSGVPDQIMHEIHMFERGKRDVRNTPRNYSFDDLDTRQEVLKDESMAQYFDELDARMEERAQQQRASREPKLLKFLPCRRSRSLPRCVKVGAEELQGIMQFEQDGTSKNKDKLINTAASGYNISSLSLGSAGGSSSSSRSTRRSSMIGSKIKSFVTGTLRPRPKSLDFDSIDVLGDEADVEDDTSSSSHSRANSHTSSKVNLHNKNSQTSNKGNLQRQMSPSVPDDISSLSSSRESKVGPGTYYYFTSSTLPRAQARKYDFPWESLPKDWTTSVKLREISKRRREERNSSSGNWSGSSNRQSLDSARSTLPSSTSQHSLSRDSGRGSPSARDDKDAGDQAAKDSGVSTFMPLSANNDTDQWLASLAKRAAAREDALAAGSDVAVSLTRLSQLTKQNVQALENTFSPIKVPALRPDEELSSVHSLDQDGFYTSFHSDSGLKRSTGTLLDDGGGRVKETRSMLSMGSSNTIDSVIFRPTAASGSESDSAQSGGKLRPPPPLRCGSRLSSNSSLVDAQEKLKSVGDALKAAHVSTSPTQFSLTVNSSPTGESSPSESDQETVYARLKAKTRISSRSIPSWCLISDEDSTDSSSVNLHRDGATANCLSLAKSVTGEGVIHKSSSLTDSNCTLLAFDAKEGDLCDVLSCSTLPWGYLESKVWEEDMADHCNSWPRSRRSHQQPTSGILKRDKSPADSMKPKTLNFAPVVNMFDHNTSKDVELPLNTMPSSSVDCTSGLSITHLSKKPAIPLSARIHSKSKSQTDLKYQPSLTLSHGQNSGGGKPSQVVRPHCVRKPAPTTPQLYAVSPVTEVKEGLGSVSSSESSLPSLSDCGQGGYLDMSGRLGHRSTDAWSSSSSTALSDLDMYSSMTYVSMSSANSTPTNSSLALAADVRPTPVNPPSLEHDTYRISPVTLSGANVKRRSLGSCDGKTVSQTRSKSQSSDLRTFAANANTEAAPVSWVGERLNSRTMSGDSGFCSPTTPTMATAGQDQLPHPRVAQADRRGSSKTSQVIEAEVHNEDSRQVRTATPPSQLSIGQKHEPLRSSHSVDSTLGQSTTPRSDSYRAATKDYWANRKGSEGSVRPSTRSQSSAEISASHPHISKSLSCPTGVLAEAEGVTRADSYRFAMRNTQGIIGDNASRNTSYRKATREDGPVPDDRMDAANAWAGSQSASRGRDLRRMGITDIDQLKCYDSDSSSSRTSLTSVNSKSSSRGFAGINSSRKKMAPEVQNLLRGIKTPSPEVKRMSKVSAKNSKDKTKNNSSTYIRFDPIFEQGDDMYSSTDTLRAESVEMITSEEGYLKSDKIVGKLPPGKVRAGGGRKNVDEKAVMSILDSIKTTIRSMSGKSSSDKDTWKYEGGGV